MLEHVNTALRVLGDCSSSASGGSGRILPADYHSLLLESITGIVALVLKGDEGLSNRQKAAFRALTSLLKFDVSTWVWLANTPGVKQRPSVYIPRELATDPSLFDRLNVALLGLNSGRPTNSVDFIERLLAGSDYVRLTETEIAQLDAYLKSSFSWFGMQNPGSLEKPKYQKLKIILDFNRNLPLAPTILVAATKKTPKRKRKADPKAIERKAADKERRKREDAILREWRAESWGKYDDYARTKNQKLPAGWPELTGPEVSRAVVAAKARQKRKLRHTQNRNSR